MATKTRSLPTQGIASLVLLALGVAACGGATPAASSPASQAAPPGAMQPEAEPDSAGQKTAPSPTNEAPVAPSTQSAAPTASGGSSSDSLQAEMRNARRDVQLATRDLDASMGDCANVCRALSSLERATAHLCALASGDSDKSACDDAKSRVQHAQAQIKASCGTCANGASLDSR